MADRLQRDAIGIELNTAYTEMAMERCRGDAPLSCMKWGPVPEHPRRDRDSLEPVRGGCGVSHGALLGIMVLALVVLLITAVT